MIIKRGESKLDIKFISNGQYTNKLYSRNVNLIDEILSFDLSHYSKRKRNNSEDTDFKLLNNLQKEIGHLVIGDDTINKFLLDKDVSIVYLKLSESNTIEYDVKEKKTCDKFPGFVYLKPFVAS